MNNIITIFAFILAIPSSIYGYITFIRDLIVRIKKRKSRSIVLKGKTKWVIVAPRYENNFQRKEDIIAANKIRDWCKDLGVDCIIQDDYAAIPSDRNVFFICGPKANKKVTGYYKDFNLELIQQEDEYVISDKSTGQAYHSKMGALEKSKADYAILARTKNRNSDQYLIFCMGIHSLGTLGAAHMLTSSFIKNISKNILKDERFESIISIPYIDEFCSIAQVDFIVPPRII